MNLLAKIKAKQAVVGIIGLGYVGLPLVLRFGEVGFKVLGFDTDASKVERLNRGSPISSTSHLPGWPPCWRKARTPAGLPSLTTTADWANRMF